MADINVQIADKEAINVQTADKEPIDIQIADKEAINVQTADKEPIDIQIADKEIISIVINSLDWLNIDRFKFFQLPTPAPDGIITIFTTPNAYAAGSLTLYRGHEALQGDGIDFTELDPNAGTFQTTEAPDADETIWCNYIRQ